MAYKAAGFDHLKNYSHFASTAIRDSAIAAAHRVGLPIIGHSFDEPLEFSLKHMKGLDHLHGYGRDSMRFQEFAATTQRAGVWNCVTQVISESAAGGLPMRPLIKALQDAGAGILAGTDIPGLPFINGVQMELEALVRAGLTSYQALTASTRNMAAYFGTSDSVGTVTTGKRADLVLLDSNPLERIAAARQIAGVMIGGRWLNRETIDRRVPTIDPKEVCPKGEISSMFACRKAPPPE
jgi:imidazolonepropionase-like amidohydrolase